MLEYYTNQNAGIFFDDNPHVCIRYYIPSMTEEERKSIEKYPFINKKIYRLGYVITKKIKRTILEYPKGTAMTGLLYPVFFGVL